MYVLQQQKANIYGDSLPFATVFGLSCTSLRHSTSFIISIAIVLSQARCALCHTTYLCFDLWWLSSECLYFMQSIICICMLGILFNSRGGLVLELSLSIIQIVHYMELCKYHRIIQQTIIARIVISKWMKSSQFVCVLLSAHHLPLPIDKHYQFLVLFWVP